MVEISSSGSGEGPERVTFPAYSTQGYSRCSQTRPTARNGLEGLTGDEQEL